MKWKASRSTCFGHLTIGLSERHNLKANIYQDEILTGIVNITVYGKYSFILNTKHILNLNQGQ